MEKPSKPALTEEEQKLARVEEEVWKVFLARLKERNSDFYSIDIKIGCNSYKIF